MKAVYSFLFVFLGLNTFAQDSLLDELDNISDSLNVEEGDTLQESSKKKEIIYGTFIGNRLINGQSSEMLGKNVFEFNIAHRFGRVNEGWRNFFGLDQASMRIGLQYGILDQLSVGVGRSTYLKTFDLYAKGKLLEQKKHGMPITAVAFAEIAFDTRKNLYPDARPTFFSQRISYTGQLIIARKFCEWFSFQVVPTVVHYNLVETKADKNTLFSVGLGSSIKVMKKMNITAEYYARIKDNPNNGYHNSLAIGFDYFTGGHVFQVQLTNSQAMFESGFIRQTTGNFLKGDIHCGCNMTRTFGFKKKEKKKNESIVEG